MQWIVRSDAGDQHDAAARPHVERVGCVRPVKPVLVVGVVRRREGLLRIVRPDKVARIGDRSKRAGGKAGRSIKANKIGRTSGDETAIGLNPVVLAAGYSAVRPSCGIDLAATDYAVAIADGVVAAPGHDGKR